ncbi:hypothetical protein [Streptomyces sp. NPDC002082]|uniref:hypothetical protein n=1 Tax=Streptomyces sp. NPDC002082 TaxID=3154772 RepID=UPI00331E52E2
MSTALVRVPVLVDRCEAAGGRGRVFAESAGSAHGGEPLRDGLSEGEDVLWRGRAARVVAVLGERGRDVPQLGGPCQRVGLLVDQVGGVELPVMDRRRRLGAWLV